MTISGEDFLLINQDDKSYKIKYETIKADIEADVSGVPEAPDDGVQYGRQNDNWTAIVPTPAYGDGDVYTYLDTSSAQPGYLLSVKQNGSIQDPYQWVAPGSGPGDSSSAELVSYQYPNGVPRTVQLRLQDYVSVKDFGAAGDGSTNDTAAFIAALDTGKGILIPAGDYKITAPLTVTNKNVSMIGAGAKSTTLTFDMSSGDGISVDIDQNNEAFYGVRLEGFRIDTRNPGPNRAIYIHSDNGAVNPNRSAYLNNLRVSGRWLQGIDLLNCRVASISDIIMGLTVGTEGILLRGSCMDSVLSNLFISQLTTGNGAGIYISGDSEGIHIEQATILNCNTGIYWVSGTDGEPALYVSNSHTNTRQYGIYADSVMQIIASDNLFYGWTGNDNLQDWTGVCIKEGGKDSVIANNIFHADGRAGSQVDTGIELNGVDVSSGLQHRTNISDNVFTKLTHAITTTGNNNINQVVASDNVFNNVQVQYHTPNGDIASAHLQNDLDRVDFNVESNGATAKTVNLALKSRDKEFKLVSQDDGGARIVQDGALTFATKASGDAITTMTMNTNGTVNVPNNFEVDGNFYLKGTNGTLWNIYVDNNGDLQVQNANP